MIKEKQVHAQVCKYIDLVYPDVIYTSDPSGLKTTIGVAVELKSKRCKKYKVPDLIILQPKGQYHGLVLEIKANRIALYTKKGEIKTNKHIKEQRASLDKLNRIGYYATFACGYDEATKIIRAYMLNLNTIIIKP